MSSPERPDPDPVDSDESVGMPSGDLPGEPPSHANTAAPIGGVRARVARYKMLAKRVIRSTLLAIKAPYRIEQLSRDLQQLRDDLIRDLHEVRNDLVRDVQNNHRRISHLEGFKREGFDDIMRHSDALYAVIDQKLDRYRLQSQELWSRLGSLLARWPDDAAEEPRVALARGWSEQAYLRFEERFRGTPSEISERVKTYLAHLPKRGDVLDLGCGRGEGLAVLKEHGLAARGVDLSGEMIAQCRAQGLEAEQTDLLDSLTQTRAGSLVGILCLHVVEHLPGEVVDRLIRAAREALAPGGVLIVETPNPLSIVVAARNFWRDPTHQRPVHPETLALLFEQSGFEPVERLDLRPFAIDERLPEVSLDELPAELRPLAERVNELRDRLDELLFGYQDYAVIGKRPLQPGRPQSLAQTS